MTREEALNTLMKMRAWREWGKEQKEEERPEMPEQKEVDEALNVFISTLQQPSLPEGLDVTDFCKPIPKEIANKMPEVIDECIWGKKDQQGLDAAAEEYAPDFSNDFASKAAVEAMRDAFRAGAVWREGLGSSREIEVKEDAGGYPYIDIHIELYDYDTDTPLAKKGDKVIVQIRKKEG